MKTLRAPVENRWLSLSAGFVATTLQVGCATVFEESGAGPDAGRDQCSEQCERGDCCAVPRAVSPAGSEPIVRPLAESSTGPQATKVPALDEAPAGLAGYEIVAARPPETRSRSRRRRRRASQANVMLNAAGAAGRATQISPETADIIEAEGGELPIEERPTPSLTSDNRNEDPVVRSLHQAVGGGGGWGGAPIGSSYP